MASYILDGYVECGYVEGNCGPTEKEVVKVFGFSRKRTIIPTNEDTSKEILKDYDNAYGRKAVAFPDQNIFLTNEVV